MNNRLDYQTWRTERLSRIKQAAASQWPLLFEAAGMDHSHFDRQNRPCPLCGGRDRFSLFKKDAEHGGWYCRHCGSGDGIALIQRFRHLTFPETLDYLEQLLVLPPLPAPSKKRAWTKREPAAQNKFRVQARKIESLWNQALPVLKDPNNPVVRYLESRGLRLAEIGRELRWLPDAPYWVVTENEDGTVNSNAKPVELGRFPVMLAPVTNEKGELTTLHRTYLTKEGAKASVPSPKKLMAGKFDPNAAVRLFPASNCLCLSEGIETALSVHAITGLPVWSLVSLSGFKHFDELPEQVTKVFIYGDNDASFAGPVGAYELAERLRRNYPGLSVTVQLPANSDEDWNDELKRLRAEGKV